MIRRTLACVGICLGALSACGGGDPSSTEDTVTETETVTTVVGTMTTPATVAGSAAPSTEGAPSNAGDKCTAADLSGVVTNAEAGAGNRYADLVVTNKSDSTCTLYGYGGLEFFGADEEPTPTDLVRVPNPGPSLVTLAPGATAVKKLHWNVVPSGDEPQTGPCEPASTGIRVIPPDDTQAFVVAYDFGSVCSGGHVEGGAYAEN